MTATDNPVDKRTGELTCVEGPVKGQVFRIPVDETRVLGRSEGTAINIPDASVSRSHCRFEPAGDGRTLHLSDLGSSNGTSMNGVAASRTPLVDGARILCGQVEFTFRYLDPSVPKKPASGFSPTTMTDFSGVEVRSASLSMDFKTDLDAAIRQKFIPSRMMYDETTGPLGTQEAWAARGLNAVCGLSEKLRRRRNPDEVIEASLDLVLGLTHTNRAAVVLKDRDTGEIRIARSKSDALGDSEPGEFQISSSVVREVLENNESLLIRDAMSDVRFKDGLSIIMSGIHCILCVPPGDEENAFGALYADTTSAGKILTEDQLTLLAAVGHQVGVALERSWLVSELQRLFVGAMHAMVRTLEAKDAYTRGHTGRVTLLALKLADQLGMERDQRDALELGGLMHDIGKIGVRDDILQKPGRLTDEEFAVIKKHPGLGALILGGMPNLDRLVSLKDVIQAVRGHHERLDGRGYPDRLRGDAVPLSARILAIADVWDALTTDRPYRKGMITGDAWVIMQKGSGDQFDSKLLEVFKELVDSGATADLSGVATSFGLENADRDRRENADPQPPVA